MVEMMRALSGRKITLHLNEERRRRKELNSRTRKERRAQMLPQKRWQLSPPGIMRKCADMVLLLRFDADIAVGSGFRVAGSPSHYFFLWKNNILSLRQKIACPPKWTYIIAHLCGWDIKSKKFVSLSSNSDRIKTKRGRRRKRLRYEIRRERESETPIFWQKRGWTDGRVHALQHANALKVHDQTESPRHDDAAFVSNARQADGRAAVVPQSGPKGSVETDCCLLMLLLMVRVDGMGK
jgi:hypothetical protein